MKKVLTIITLAATLFAVSCNKEKEMIGSGQSNLATVTFTVDAGQTQMNTRAVSGNHGTATRLMVGVYLQRTDGYHYLSAISQSNTVSSWPAVVSLELARSETYKLVFWADDGSDPYTIDWTNATVSETSTTIGGNLLSRDAFYKMIEITPSGAASQGITLARPLAQVNVGTDDLAAYKALAEYVGAIETQVVLKGVAPGLNLLTGGAAEGAAQNLTFTQADDLASAPLVSGGKSYSHLAMNYVLCPADATLTADISIRKDGESSDINAFTVSNMPVKQNYRTNVVGKLLTGTVSYSVDIDTDFIDDVDKQVAPSFASVSALNAYFATMADNSDNGDILPEEVTVTAIADGETIILPAIAGDVLIRIPAILSDGTLNIAYAASGDKPANVSLYVAKLQKLVANLPSTHFTLLAGSHITDTAEVYTSSSTFVIEETARVGSLAIKQGNAEISGQVATVNVAADATSDGAAPGAANAVQVKLNASSAVNEIVLAAKSDVVVEQPKDRIEVGATENKVAVYVNAGAANSTAKAQNGGVIFVMAAVPCSVTADGTPVASTVFIGSGAAGSEIVALAGGAIDLTANGNCTAYAEGKDLQDNTPSTITVVAADASAEVNTGMADGGTVNNESGQDVLVHHAAKIGNTSYATLALAVAAVPDDEETVITLQNHYVIEGNAGITISSTKNIVLDLNGWLLSNAVDENTHSQVFNNMGTLTIRDSKGNGKLFNAVKEGAQPGEWWSEPQNNYATNVIKNSGTLIIQGGTIQQTAGGSICYAIDNNSTSYDTITILEGGVITSNGTTMRMFCNSTVKENKLIMPEGSTALLEGNYTALWVQLPGSNPSSMKKATLDIKGGTIKGNSYAYYDYSFGDGWDNVNYDISGGTFIGEIYTYKPGYKFIRGGNFTYIPVYIMANYMAVEAGDGTYNVVEGSAPVE